MGSVYDLESRRRRGPARRPAGTPPPHDLDLERAVIADVLFDEERAAKGQERLLPKCAGLMPKHFWYDDHGVIWTAVLYLAELGDPYDVPGVVNELRNTGKLKEAGGTPYVADVLTNAPVRPNIHRSAQKLVELSAHRDYLERLQFLAAEGRHARDGATFTAEATEELSRLAQAAQPEPDNGMQATAEATLAGYEEGKRRRLEGGGLPTTLRELDDVTNGGLHPREWTLVHAPPGSGKSALCQQLCLTAAGQGHGVYICTLEMDREELTRRWCSQLARIPARRFRRFELSPDQEAAFTASLDAVKGLPILIDDQASHPGMTWPMLRARVLAAKAAFERQGKRLGLVLIDHLGLLELAPKQTRYDGMLEAGRGIQKSMVAFDCHVLVIVHEKDGRVRDCPALTGEAYNRWRLSLAKGEPSVFNPDAVPMTVTIEKQRNGEAGVQASTWFHGPYLRFSDKEQVQ